MPAGGDGLLAYYEVHGLTWGAADLLAVQGGDAATRAGTFAAIFRAFSVDDPPAVREILVVWPPLGDEAQVADRIETGMARFWAERAMHVLTESEVDALWRAVRIARAETLEQEHVVALIRSAPPATAVIVSHAALYRAADVGDPGADAAGPEDFWAPHVHRPLVQAVAAHDQAGAYVVVDAGKDLPTAGVTRDLLLSVDGCGVLSPNDVENRPGTGRIPASHLAWWEAMAAAGQLGAAFAEVAAPNGPPARVIAMLRARVENLPNSDLRRIR